MRYIIFAVILMPTLAQAQPIPATSMQVVVSVSVPKPMAAPRAAVEAAMAKSAPIYAKVPGLIRKYFTIGTADFGGIYLFRDRASAQAWFSDAWRARATTTYGTQPVVTYFDAPIVIDNSMSK